MKRILWNEGERKTIDEIAIDNAYIHIEQMDDNWYSIVIATDKGKNQICFSIGAKRAAVDFKLSWEDGWTWEKDETHP